MQVLGQSKGDDGGQGKLQIADVGLLIEEAER
jgi:hypothetical protein